MATGLVTFALYHERQVGTALVCTAALMLASSGYLSNSGNLAQLALAMQVALPCPQHLQRCTTLLTASCKCALTK